MNFSVLHLIAGLFLLVVIFFSAKRSAFCILRKKEIHPDVAKDVTNILSVAFFVVYLFTALLSYLLLTPQVAEPFRTMIAQPANIAPVVPIVAIPHGKMAAEQGRVERQRLLAEETELLIRAAEERHQLFSQKSPYVVPEGISGTEDKYIVPHIEQLAPPATPSENALDENKISVQELVASTEGISSILPEQHQQPLQIPVQSSAEQIIPLQEPPSAPAASEMNSPAQVVTPQQQALPEILQPPATPAAIPKGIDQQIAMTQQQPVQSLPAIQKVSCEEIKGYMDNTDYQVLRSAIIKQAGVVTPWKGPNGAYHVTAGAIKGSCREYSIQANLSGKSLQCHVSCVSSTSIAAPANSRMIPQQRSDQEVIRDSMNSSDQDAFIKALTYHGPVSWRSLNGVFYTVAPVRLYGPCKVYHVQANIQGRVFQYNESNCQ